MSLRDTQDLLDGSPLDGPAALANRVYQTIKLARADAYEQGYRQGYDAGYYEAELDAAVGK